MKKILSSSLALLAAATLSIETTNAQLYSPGAVNTSGTGGVSINTMSGMALAPLDVVGSNILLRPSDPFNNSGNFIGIGQSGGICDLYGFRSQRVEDGFINVGVSFSGAPGPADNIPTISWGATAANNFRRPLQMRYDNNQGGCGALVAEFRADNVAYQFVVLGDAYATGSWVTSDARFKQNIKPIGGALDRITQLNGTTYDMNVEAFPTRNFKAGKHYGFLAQELQKVFPEMVKQDDDGYLAVNYDAMVPVLVEGIKAQQAQLEEQQEVLEQQDAAIRELQAQMQSLLNETSGGKKDAAATAPATPGSLGNAEEKSALFQNRPNPAINDTEINFYLPNDVEQASLVIFNIDGREVKRYNNLSRGYANVLLRAGELPAGTYVYNLVADNEVVGSKTMILSK